MNLKINPPLRYPGSKSRANKILHPIYQQLSDSIKDYREPFIGGGSVALYHQNVIWKQRTSKPDVWINDLYVPLYCFWWTLQNNSVNLINSVRLIREKHKGIVDKKGNITGEDMKEQFFQSLKILESHVTSGNEMSDDEKTKLAINYYIVNRCCRSGMTSVFSEWASRPGTGGTFNHKKINELSKVSEIIREWKITNEDYSVLLETPSSNNPLETFVFLDPPYMLGKQSTLYGTDGEMHKGFPHTKFRDDIVKCPFSWVITYNSCPELKEMYDVSGVSYDEWDLRYSMQQHRDVDGNKKTIKKVELLIASNNIKIKFAKNAKKYLRGMGDDGEWILPYSSD